MARSTGMLAEVEAQPKFRRPGEGRGGNIFHVFHFGKITIKETGKERERVQLCLGLSQELGLAIPALRRLNKASSDLQI